MKRLAISLMFLLTLSPALASAQVMNQAVKAQLIVSIREQIKVLTIELLKLEIQDLTNQLSAIIASGMTDTAQLPVEPTVVAPVSSPSASFRTICDANESDVEIEINSLEADYSKFETRITGQATNGQNVNQGNSFTRNIGPHVIYGVPAGSFSYSIKALKGATAMGTENTANDTREVVWSGSGTLSVSSCQ